MEPNDKAASSFFPRLRFALLAGGVLIFALVLLAAKGSSLKLDRARETAIVARNLADGDGYTTDILLPPALSHDGTGDSLAETRQPPGHPLLLAGVFLLCGPSDQAVIIPSLLAWMACALAVYLLAALHGRPGTGLLGALFVLMNTAGLRAGLNGLFHPFLALLMLLFAALLLLPPKEKPAPPGRARSFSAGLLLALILSFQPLMLAALVPLLFFLRGRASLRAILLPFAGGFLVVLLPWLAWAIFAQNPPVPALFFHHIPSGTDYHPGNAIWRAVPLGVEHHPLLYPFVHPRQTFLKLIEGLSRFWQEGPVVFHPLLMLLALTALLDPRYSPQTRRILLAAAAGILLLAPLASLFEQDVALLLVWTIRWTV